MVNMRVRIGEENHESGLIFLSSLPPTPSLGVPVTLVDRKKLKWCEYSSGEVCARSSYLSFCLCMLMCMLSIISTGRRPERYCDHRPAHHLSSADF